jgi:biopolymer transport protein ExbB/biopolymer transport protein TolQ
MELSFLELWRATGPLARGVVVLLGGMSVGSGAVAVDKWLRLRKAERASEAFLTEWRAADARGGVEAVAARHPDSPVAGVVAAASAALATVPREQWAEAHDRTVRRFVLATSSELRRGLSVLATVGSTAPFVGLFGTVIGIVNAFHEIGTSGRGGIATVSTGIAEALVTTAFGILVAIPAVWLFNALGQRIGRLLAKIECAGEELAVARLAAPSPTHEAPRAERVRERR